MAAIDAEYWDKCVSKVFKEVHQYMIYDGLITPPEDVIEENLVPEAPLPDSVTEGDGDDVIVPANDTISSEDENNDELKNVIVKQCTEELISPSKLASMHKKSEKTIRKWLKSSGVPLPQKYQQKSKQTITFSTYKEDRSLSTANNATQSLTKELILNLKSKWPSLMKANETFTSSYPGGTIYKSNKPYFLSQQSCRFLLNFLYVCVLSQKAVEDLFYLFSYFLNKARTSSDILGTSSGCPWDILGTSSGHPQAILLTERHLISTFCPKIYFF